MSKDKSRAKAGQPSAPETPYTGTESLDFTDRTPTSPPAADAAVRPEASRSRSVVRPRKTTGSSDRDKAGSSRRLAVPVLIVIAIGVLIAFAATKRSTNEPVTPSPSAAPGSPAYQSPSA